MYEEGYLCSDCGAWMRKTQDITIGNETLYVYQCTECRKVELGYQLFRITPIHLKHPCPQCNTELEFKTITDDENEVTYVCENGHKVIVQLEFGDKEE